MKTIFAVLLVASLPTFATDVYAASNVHDARNTTYVTQSEMAAASWIKAHTPADAVVQSLIDYPGVHGYSLTICFGERRAALGLWKMAIQRYPNKIAITDRVRLIRTAFSSEDSAERRRIAHQLHIDFVFIGPRERARFPGVDRRFATDTSGFAQVYAFDGVRIFQVRA